MEYKGIAKKVFERNGRHSILCDDDKWYGNGNTKPPCSDNDQVKFEYEMNGKYMNITPGTIQRKDNPNPPVDDGYKGKKGGGGAGGSGFQADKAAREAYWAKKDVDSIATQKIISFNGALNTATTIISSAVANELITLKGKAGAKYDAYFAMILEEAETIFRTLQRVPENYDALMGGDAVPDLSDEALSDILPKEDDAGNWDASVKDEDEW